jgi:hypothetical protein
MSPTTFVYTFIVYALVYEIVAADDDSAQRAASIKLLQDKITDPGSAYYWERDEDSPEVFRFIERFVE